MNSKRIKQLRDRIASCNEPDSGHSFNMSRMTHSCGSPACLGGHCADLAGERQRLPGWSWRVLQRYLDIDTVAAQNLYFGMFSPKNLADITTAEAIAALDELRETGKVEKRVR